MIATHRRHHLADQVWEQLGPHLPGEAGTRGRPAQDNRRFLNGMFRTLRTGTPAYQVRGRPWPDLPPDYGAGATGVTARRVGGHSASARNAAKPCPYAVNS